MNKFCLVVFALLPVIFLAGCWSAVEINERAFVRMMILDKVDDGIELTIVIPLPSRLIPGQSIGSGGDQGKAYTYITKTGPTIGDAYSLIQVELSREITFGQTGVIVIGSNLAREGIQPILEFIAREPRFHINANLYVIQGKAINLTHTPTVLERFPTEILLAYSRQHVIVKATATDALKASYYGGDFILPLLIMEKKSLPSEKSPNTQWLKTHGAVLFKEGKMAASLDLHQMRGAMWILEQIRDAVITVKSDQAGHHNTYRIQQVNSRIEPLLKDNQITIAIQTKAEASLIASSSDEDQMDPLQQKKMQKRLEEKIVKIISEAVDLARKEGSDAYQFGPHIDWRYPKYWKKIKPQWRDIYRNQIKIRPSVDISINRIGAIRQPVKEHPYETEGKRW